MFTFCDNTALHVNLCGGGICNSGSLRSAALCTANFAKRGTTPVSMSGVRYKSGQTDLFRLYATGADTDMYAASLFFVNPKINIFTNH